LLAVIGILLPVMPTTIFVILAAYFFAKGSERLHSWLISNKIFGTYLMNYREGRGMTIGSKLFSISFLWAGIIYSIFITDILWLKILLLLIAITVSIHIIWIKTYRKDSSET